MADTALQPAELAAGMVLEDGRTWGSVAAPFQLEDLRTIFAAEVLWHYLTRPRGGSKSTDLAVMLLAWLVCDAGPGEHGYIVASDRDQGAFAVLDAIIGLVRRTPALQGRVTVQANKVVATSGATVEVLSADAASTWGLRPKFLVVDELAAWPDTRNARNVWTALISATGKMPGCRLVCLTSAGEPSHWSHKVLATARKSKRWHVNEVPGPLPWADSENLAEQRLILTDSQYQRLHMNVWTEAEDRLVSLEDLEAAMVLDGDLPPQPGVRYCVSLDAGLVRDRTVVMVGHREETPDGPRVVVDALWRRQGTRRNPVELDEVEEAIADYHARYPGSVFVDEARADYLVQRIRKREIPIHVFNFTTTSVGLLASALIRALRTHSLLLPNDPVLRDELLTVRIRENSAGVARLDHDSAGHDDHAVACSLLVYWLLQDRYPSGFVFADDDGVPISDVLGRPFRSIVSARFAGSTAIPHTIGSRMIIDERDDDEGPPPGAVKPSPFV